MNELGRCYYKHFTPKYIEAFFQHLGPIMEDTSEEKSCILAMEFWTTLLKEEQNIESNPDRMRVISPQLRTRLVQAFLQNLCAIEDGDEDDCAAVREGAVSALETIFEDSSLEY